MTGTIFIDECLSVALVVAAKARGVHAVYGPYLGMGGWQDWNLVQTAIENGYVIVTNNRRDLLREYAKHDVHDGLIVIVPNTERAGQIALFSRALDTLLSLESGMGNKLIEILSDGVIHIRTWTCSDHDIAHVQSPHWS